MPILITGSVPHDCTGCRFYEDDSDPSVGMYGPPYCTAVPTEEDGMSEASQEFLTAIVFTLSEMRRCPHRKEPDKPTRRYQLVNTETGEIIIKTEWKHPQDASLANNRYQSNRDKCMWMPVPDQETAWKTS